MTNIQKSVPVLRFKDELGNCYPPWGEKKFSFIAKKVNDSYKPTNNGESFECIELESLSSETGLLIRTFRSSEQKSMKTKFLTGDVLFGKLRPYLKKFYRSDFDGVCTSEIWVLRPKSVPSEFLFYVVQSGHFNRLANIQSGTKMPRSNWGIVSQSIFKIPSDYGEQQKIASFLSSVDTKIEQLSEKKALLEQYKKGMMQKLFNQEIRFKDERGKNYAEWEQSKLGNIGTTFNGLTGKNSTHFGKGKPYIQYLQVFENSRIDVDNFGFVEIGENESQNEVCSGDVFFTTSSETPNEVGTASVLIDEVENTYLNSFCFGYRVNKEYLLPEFARFAFRANGFRKRVVRLAQGSTRYNLSKTSLMKIETNLPRLQEQQKIANFLSAIDKKIELVAEQLEQARTFKKGLLQQMFI